MYRVDFPGRSRHFRTLLIVVALFGLTASVLPIASGYHVASALAPPIGVLVPASHGGSASSGAASTNSLAAHGSTPSASVHPASSSTGTFWTNSGKWFVEPTANYSCYNTSFGGPTYKYYYNYCSNESVAPSFLNLANGNIGVVYSTTTDANHNTCRGVGSYVIDRVEISISSNNGSTFGSPKDIGNDSSCSYPNALEPSFVVAPSGTVYGVFVEANFSGSQGDYTYRAGDALGFVSSTNNGVTFSAPVTINRGGNISKPQLAVFGHTLYVLYENISNGTTSVDYGLYGLYSPATISEDLLVSKNLGTSWTGPTVLPGQNATANNNAMGGWISVNKTGTLGAAYFTNHDCVSSAPSWGYACFDYGDNLVYTISLNNGTSWAPLTTVMSGVGESQEYTDGFYLDSMFQVIPQAQLMFSANGESAYIVWAGTFNKTILNLAPYEGPYYDYNSGGVYFAVGTSTGASWTVTPISLPYGHTDDDDLWNPSMGVWNGTIYVAWTRSNDTYCEQYGAPACDGLDGGYNEWDSTSTNGINWTSPGLVQSDPTCEYGFCETYEADESFSGYNSVVGFTSAGSPRLVYAMPNGDSDVFSYTYNSTFFYTYYINFSDPTTLYIATPYTGPTVSVNFTEIGLAPGTSWTVGLNGEQLTTTDSWYNVTNVPVGTSVDISTPLPVQIGYGTVLQAISTVTGAASFSKDTTIVIDFTKSYLFQVNTLPRDASSDIYWYDSLGNENYYETYLECFPCTNFVTYSYYPDGQYYPNGTHLLLMGEEGISYWNGTGTGAFTGVGQDANVTITSVTNETGWVGAWGVYNASFTSVGLPASSTVYFDFNGAQYSGAANEPINVSGVDTGAYLVTNVWATSTLAGYEYFGLPSPANPIVVPAETNVDLLFSLVDLSAPTGTVSFQAQGLTDGTIWSFSFNGTTFSSDTPWINVTTHPGTFQVEGFPVVAENDSVGYTPSGVGPTITVATGSTYLIDFVHAYKVTVVAGTGGTVTGGTGEFWIAEGATAKYVAVAKTGYGFGGWSGTGLGNYTGNSSYANLTVNGPIVQTASFYPLPGSRFNLTFVEVGLAAGTWWTAYLSGMGFSSNASTFQVHDLLACGDPGGNYNLTIPYAYSSNDLVRYLPTSHLSPAVCTTGTTVINEVFTAEYYLTLQSTAGGIAEATIGSNVAVTSIWVAAGASVDLSAVGQTGYDFLGWNGTGSGNYTGPSIVQAIVMSGPVSELATFQLHQTPPPPTYTITFKEANSLDAGTVWGITLGTTGYSSTGGSLTVPGLTAGNYALSVPTALSPAGTTRYASLGNPSTVTISHNATVTLSFSTSFWVAVEGTPGGTTVPGSGWVSSGGSILLNATPNLGFVFDGWNGTGASSYSGSNSMQSVVVAGPITEVATFAPLARTVSTTTSGSSLWSQPTTWIGLGLVGLLVGLVVGILVSRSGGRRPPPPAAYQAPPAGSTEPPVGDMSPPQGDSP
jgi:Divergent InlB B-repeat domain